MPTSTEIIASSGMCFESDSATAAGSIAPLRLFSARERFSALHSAQAASISARESADLNAPLRLSASAGAASDTSPKIAASTGYLRPIATASRSICTTLLPAGTDVWRLNPTPKAITQSARAINLAATAVPLSPCTPHASGWESGIIPFAG